MKLFTRNNEKTNREIEKLQNMIAVQSQRLAVLENKIASFEADRSMVRDRQLDDFQSILHVVVNHLQLKIKRIDFPERFKVMDVGETQYHDGW